MKKRSVCNLSFAKFSIISASETELTLNYSNIIVLTLLYINFKYHILFLTNLLINIKETERNGVYKIPSSPPSYGIDVNQQIWLCSLFLSVDYYFTIDFDFKNRNLNS